MARVSCPLREGLRKNIQKNKNMETSIDEEILFFIISSFKGIMKTKIPTNPAKQH